jgi:Fe-S cluster assembly ATP-binding protein
LEAVLSVAVGVNALRSPERAMLVITHYQRLLDYIKPDRVHVLAGGRIVASGGPELAHELEREGYERYEKAAA